MKSEAACFGKVLEVQASYKVLTYLDIAKQSSVFHAMHRKQQSGLPLKLIITSATLDGEKFSTYFNDCPVSF
jgi:hypothetical protein